MAFNLTVMRAALAGRQLKGDLSRMGLDDKNNFMGVGSLIVNTALQYEDP